VLLVLAALFLLMSGPALYAQGGDGNDDTPTPAPPLDLTDLATFELPIDYTNEETGLSFQLPEEWVVADGVFPTVYVANDDEAMAGPFVVDDDLFITIRIWEWAEWEDGEATDGLTALEVAEYYQQDARNDTSVMPEIVTPPTTLPDFELDAALLSGNANGRDWVYIILIPTDGHIMRVQAATIEGRAPEVIASVLAFTETIRYDGREIEILRLIEERRAPVVVDSPDLNFTFDHIWWLQTEILDDWTVELTANPAAENPWPETSLNIALPAAVPYAPDFRATLRFEDNDTLPDAERVSTPLAIATARLLAAYPDATITDELDRDTGAAGRWARVYATTPDGLQVAQWVVRPTDFGQLVTIQSQSREFFDEFQAQLAGILNADLPGTSDMLIYSGPFPPGG